MAGKDVYRIHSESEAEALLLRNRYEEVIANKIGQEYDMICNTLAKAKPFIKWVGGKGQLIEQLETTLPVDFGNWEDVTYIEPFVGGGAMLFYFDPPYRPLSDTSSFNDYTKEAFNDDAQIRLKEYCDRIHAAGYKFMLSNSDCKGKNEADNFFDVLYGAYDRARIYEQNGTPNIVCRNYKSN